MQTRRELDRRAERSLPRESFGELLVQLADNSAALVRDEIELARQEMSEKVSAFRSGIVTLAVGSIVALVAFLTLTTAAVIGLASYIGPGAAALIIGAALAVIGAATGFAGLSQIRRTKLKPEQTIETLEEDKEWLKELA